MVQRAISRSAFAFSGLLALIVANEVHAQTVEGGATAASPGFDDPTAVAFGPGGTADGKGALWLAHTESGNVLRSFDGERGSYDGIGIRTNLRRQRSRMQGGLLGSLEYRHYSDDLADDERVGYLVAFSDFTVVPERFTWSFRDSYSQGRTDSFGVDSPGNRENVNVLSTGPQLDLPLGNRTWLRMTGTYSDRRYEESSLLDSRASVYDVGVFRKTNLTTTFGLSGQTRSIDYNGRARGYDIDSLQLSYEKTLASGSASAAIGSNRLKSDSAKTEPVFSLEWTRTLTPRSSLRLSGERGFTDTGQLFELAQSQGGGGDDILLSPDATDRRRFGVDYSWRLVKTNLVIRAEAFRDEFDGSTKLNSDGHEVSLELSRQLTSSVQLGTSAHRLRRDFVQEGTNWETITTLWLNRQIGRRVELEAHVQRAERHGFGEYSERSYQVMLIYVPGRWQ